MTAQLFRTPSGTPVPAVTAAEMREVDRLAVEAFGIDLLQMMENAGRTLAWHARELADGGAVTVVAGNGGNGGGGLVCARHLANRDVPVEVLLDRRPGDLEGAAAHQHATLAEMDVPVAVGPDADDPRDVMDGAALVVDALIGYGLSGAVRGPAAGLVGATNAADASVLSLDVPSGRNATTGEQPGPAVDPERLLTLALPKTGLQRLDCPLVLGDISIPAALYERMDLAYELPFGDQYWVGLTAAGD